VSSTLSIAPDPAPRPAPRSHLHVASLTTNLRLSPGDYSVGLYSDAAAVLQPPPLESAELTRRGFFMSRETMKDLKQFPESLVVDQFKNDILTMIA
jgi:hypothetical protein